MSFAGQKPLFRTTPKGSYEEVDLLLVDVSWVAKRHEFALGQRFETSDGRMSGHVYGAYRDIVAQINALWPKEIAFCYDRGYDWRLEYVPGYKQTRRKSDASDPNYVHVAGDVERLFRSFPGYHLCLEGFEGDDMVGLALENIPREGAAVIYSRDKDLWQLIRDQEQVCVIEPGEKKGKRGKKAMNWVHEKQVKEKMGISPYSIPKWKALTGDKADNIQGLDLRWPGKMNALKEFVLTIGSDEYFDPQNSSPSIDGPDWLVGPLMDQREKVLANFEIVSIPNALSRIGDVEMVKDSGKLSAAMDVLAEFECESLLGQVPTLFEKTFKAQGS